MKKFIALLGAALLVVSLSATALAAPVAKYLPFGSATVTQGPAGTFTIVSDGPDLEYAPAPEYGGVYLNTKSQGKHYVADVKLSFVSSGAVAGGAPRLSVPIDADGNGTTEFYAFLDVNGCGSTTVSTTSATCSVNAGPETFANWAAFATAHPTYRVYTSELPFIIADGTLGTYVVGNIVLR